MKGLKPSLVSLVVAVAHRGLRIPGSSRSADVLEPVHVAHRHRQLPRVDARRVEVVARHLHVDGRAGAEVEDAGHDAAGDEECEARDVKGYENRPGLDKEPTVKPFLKGPIWLSEKKGGLNRIFSNTLL